MVPVFLNGEAMRGGSIHHNVRESDFLGPARTAAAYTFYSVRGEFPGLHRVDDGGFAIEGELYEMDEETIRTSLLPGEPPELELGVIELNDGRSVFSMIIRREHLADDDVRDISAHGSWRAYSASRVYASSK